ncbi:hypothetical protein F5Y10DRAFT_288017 [Nemania abortiva]|nr:hypothetical protein F5Y10DRAFT_288017 [Nemania abortiva]
MDDNWSTESLSGSDLSRAIIAIHLVAYPGRDVEDYDEPVRQTNHWCLFLEFENDTSVRLDICPGYGSDGLRGKVRLMSKPHTCTSNDIHKITFNVNSTASLKDLVSIAQAKGRQKYEFARGWEGCRHWNYVFIQDLERHNILPRGAASQAWDAMSCFYHSVRGVEIRSMKVGTFLA